MKHEKIANYLQVISIATTIITFIVYGIWFIYSLEKRLSIEEEITRITMHKIDELKQISEKENQNQDQNTNHYRSQINNRVERIEDKIDKIYTLMLDDLNISKKRKDNKLTNF